MFKLEIEPSETLHTQWGIARKRNDGYYYISSSKQGFNNKLLHRLVFEYFYGEIPKCFHIHHKDGNCANNCILNLQLLHHSEHSIITHTGRKNKEETLLKMSNCKNNTGYFRVSKHKNKQLNQGFNWRYAWYEDGKKKDICKVNLKDLEKEVKNRGLEWKVIKYD